MMWDGYIDKVKEYQGEIQRRIEAKMRDAEINVYQAYCVRPYIALKYIMDFKPQYGMRLKMVALSLKDE